MNKQKQSKKPGIRLSTLMRDKEILKRLKQGKAPKEVAHEMGLSSVWVVYDCIRRFMARCANRYGYNR